MGFLGRDLYTELLWRFISGNERSFFRSFNAHNSVHLLSDCCVLLEFPLFLYVGGTLSPRKLSPVSPALFPQRLFAQVCPWLPHSRRCSLEFSYSDNAICNCLSSMIPVTHPEEMGAEAQPPPPSCLLSPTVLTSAELEQGGHVQELRPAPLPYIQTISWKASDVTDCRK